MPFRNPKIYLTREDLEAEYRALQAYEYRKACRNPFKRFYWWLTGADDAYFNPKRKDPPSSWKRY